MVVQFLGHVEGCLEWFDKSDCCPEGCPSLDGCNLVITLNYPDNINIVAINEPALNYALNDYIDCQLSSEIADIPEESGGDISVLIKVEYHPDCKPKAVITSITYSSPESEFLVPLTIDIVCV